MIEADQVMEAPPFGAPRGTMKLASSKPEQVGSKEYLTGGRDGSSKVMVAEQALATE